MWAERWTTICSKEAMVHCHSSIKLRFHTTHHVHPQAVRIVYWEEDKQRTTTYQDWLRGQHALSEEGEEVYTVTQTKWVLQYKTQSQKKAEKHHSRHRRIMLNVHIFYPIKIIAIKRAMAREEICKTDFCYTHAHTSTLVGEMHYYSVQKCCWQGQATCTLIHLENICLCGA